MAVLGRPDGLPARWRPGAAPACLSGEPLAAPRRIDSRREPEDDAAGDAVTRIRLLAGTHRHTSGSHLGRCVHLAWSIGDGRQYGVTVAPAPRHAVRSEFRRVPGVGQNRMIGANHRLTGPVTQNHRGRFQIIPRPEPVAPHGGGNRQRGSTAPGVQGHAEDSGVRSARNRRRAVILAVAAGYALCYLAETRPAPELCPEAGQRRYLEPIDQAARRLAYSM